MKLGRLNHIGVATPSIADSIAYYRDTMGATQITEPFDLPEQGDPVELHRQLKQHDDAGPLVRGLENWLHRPPGTTAVDITALLEPYRESAQPK